MEDELINIADLLLTYRLTIPCGGLIAVRHILCQEMVAMDPGHTLLDDVARIASQHQHRCQYSRSRS